MTTSDATNADPRLQPPGAGLPGPELFILRRIIFPLACRRLDWAAAEALFRDEGNTILALWDALPPDRLTEQVLIRRLRGIEDSSRHWSAAMTVEHLNIVGAGIRGIIAGLRRGEVPDRVTRVADVKPTGSIAPAEVRAAFMKLLADTAANEPPIARGVGVRYKHPWFGPLDAFEWHCLLGIHQRIHRKQLEAIIGGLGVA